MTHPNPKFLTETIISAVNRSGYCAIISRGWAGLGDSQRTDFESHDNFLFTNDVPHSLLFSHIRAVVHHGGAGSTASHLQHGKPAPIIPFVGDQFFWGNLLSYRGLSPKPLPVADLTAGKLVDSLRQLLDPANEYINRTQKWRSRSHANQTAQNSPPRF